MIGVGVHHGAQQDFNQPDCLNYLSVPLCCLSLYTALQGFTCSSKPHYSRGGVTPHLQVRIKLFVMVVTRGSYCAYSYLQILRLPQSSLLYLASLNTGLMECAMGNVLGTEKTKFNKHTSTNTSLQTPPRTPTFNATAAQTLASEIRDIHHALSELPDLRPGDKVNTLLTCLVSLCVIPYSSEFINYFFNIDGMHVLCEKLRPLCATAEGELERFWASKIVDESSRSRGTSITTTHIPRDPKICRLDTSLTSSSNTIPNPSPPQHLPLPPKLY